MPSTAQEPSQAEPLQHVTVTGEGADDNENVGDRSSEKASNGFLVTPSNESDEVIEAKEDAEPEGTSTVQPQAPERSKAKVALIMASLMVRDTGFGKFEYKHC